MKILILTAADGEIREIGDLSASNKSRYAEMYGYDCVYAKEYLPWCNWQSYERSWNKIPLIQKYLGSYDWLWWSDADSLIRNFTINLDGILDTDKDLVIGRDHQPFVMPTAPSIPISRVGMINAGNFFIRNCEWSFSFLSKLRDSTGIKSLGYYLYEQGAMIRLLDHMDNSDHVEYVPIRTFNSYSQYVGMVSELSWKTRDMYQDGDFVIHWAGVVPSNAGVLEDMRRPKTRFGILTLADDNMRRLGDLSATGKLRYADKHGYDFIYRKELFDKARDGSWNKIPWIERHLPDYEWLLWTDADCLICNSDIRLEDILGETDKDLVIGWDHQPCLNAGNFFIRNCPWSFDFLKRVYNRHDEGGFLNGRWQRGHPYCEREQGVMQSFINEGSDGRHVDLRGIRQLGFSYRHNKLKAHPRGFSWAIPDTYVRGDFLKHYGGWWCQEAERLTKMWDPVYGNSEFIP